MHYEDRFHDPRYRVPFETPALWERSRMTVCIAAICQEKDAADSIAFCTDWKISGALGSAETFLKIRSLGNEGWLNLTSGYESDKSTKRWRIYYYQCAS